MSLRAAMTPLLCIFVSLTTSCFLPQSNKDENNTSDTGVPLEFALGMLKAVTELNAQGLKTDIRVQVGAPTYNAIAMKQAGTRLDGGEMVAELW